MPGARRSFMRGPPVSASGASLGSRKRLITCRLAQQAFWRNGRRSRCRSNAANRHCGPISRSVSILPNNVFGILCAGLVRSAPGRYIQPRLSRAAVAVGPIIMVDVPDHAPRLGRIAQLVEQLTLNQRVQGSSPCAPTRLVNYLSALLGQASTSAVGLLLADPTRTQLAKNKNRCAE